MSFKKTRYQLDLFLKRKKFFYIYNKKIKWLLKRNNIQNLSKNNINKIQKRFEDCGYSNINIDWHKFYNSFHSGFNTDFIPESIFYTQIESSLNRFIMLPALEDKNLLDHFFDPSSLPKVILKNINGYYYINNKQILFDAAIDTCSTWKEFVIKPSIGTSGGKGVIKYVIKNIENPKQEIEKLLLSYKSDFIVQDIVVQNSELKKLNPTSLNTIRVMSYMRENDVVILSAVVRIGRKGKFTDNTTSGGIACGINSNGTLKDFAINTIGERFYKSDNGITLKDFKIPKYLEILDFAKENHKKLPYFRIVSWDICINNNSDIMLVEYNSINQEINFHQMTNGPLLGNYMKEILLNSKKHNPLEN